jgi:hypothetical protein
MTEGLFGQEDPDKYFWDEKEIKTSRLNREFDSLALPCLIREEEA